LRLQQLRAALAGPFPSPYHFGSDFDNVVLVASGIGITPAIAFLAKYREEKSIAVIWICRDPSLVRPGPGREWPSMMAHDFVANQSQTCSVPARPAVFPCGGCDPSICL
jgi:ferredoxin-NADP reductase